MTTSLVPPEGISVEERADAMQALLTDARVGKADTLGPLLQSYRNYLTILATTQLDQRLRRRMNP